VLERLNNEGWNEKERDGRERGHQEQNPQISLTWFHGDEYPTAISTSTAPVCQRL
jgi:hypothetical protein